MILGLDISTSITGATVLDNNGKVVFNEAWDFRNKKHFPTIFEKATEVSELFKALKKEYNFDSIYIEQSLQSFRSGFSSAHTLSLLSRFNGVVSWLCYEIFALEPHYLAASSARKLCGIKIPKGQKAKAVSLQFVIDSVPGFEVQYTRHGNPKPGYTDRSDSYVIARAGWLNERQET